MSTSSFAAPAAPSTTTTTPTTTMTPCTSRIQQDMAVIASYPALLSQEEQMIKTPYSVTGWCLYLATMDDLLESLQEFSKRKTTKSAMMDVGGKEATVQQIPSLLKELIKIRIRVAERAVSLLPGSYKLWQSHLKFLVFNKLKFTKLTRAFEQALTRLHKMPRVWLDYLAVVVESSPKCDYDTTSLQSCLASLASDTTPLDLAIVPVVAVTRN